MVAAWEGSMCHHYYQWYHHHQHQSNLGDAVECMGNENSVNQHISAFFIFRSSEPFVFVDNWLSNIICIYIIVVISIMLKICMILIHSVLIAMIGMLLSTHHFMCCWTIFLFVSIDGSGLHWIDVMGLRLRLVQTANVWQDNDQIIRMNCLEFVVQRLWSYFEFESQINGIGFEGTSNYCQKSIFGSSHRYRVNAAYDILAWPRSMNADARKFTHILAINRHFEWVGCRCGRLARTVSRSFSFSRYDAFEHFQAVSRFIGTTLSNTFVQFLIGHIRQAVPKHPVPFRNYFDRYWWANILTIFFVWNNKRKRHRIPMAYGSRVPHIAFFIHLAGY